MKNLTEEEIIKLAEAMGFVFDGDFGYKGVPEWLRFTLLDSMIDECALRWIWYLDKSLTENIKTGADILFRAGKKKKVLEINKY
jgi:hypothetical protein